MKKAIAKIGALTAVAVSLSGCVGSNAVTGYVMGFNLKAVDNRYARGGLNSQKEKLQQQLVRQF